MTYNVEKEIAAIGVCMKAVSDLEMSEALRVLAYTADFIGAQKLSSQAYQDSRRWLKLEASQESATAPDHSGAA